MMMMMKCKRCLTSWYQHVASFDSLTNSRCARFPPEPTNGEGKTRHLLLDLDFAVETATLQNGFLFWAIKTLPLCLKHNS